MHLIRRAEQLMRVTLDDSITRIKRHKANATCPRQSSRNQKCSSSFRSLMNIRRELTGCWKP